MEYIDQRSGVTEAALHEISKNNMKMTRKCFIIIRLQRKRKVRNDFNDIEICHQNPNFDLDSQPLNINIFP